MSIKAVAMAVLLVVGGGGAAAASGVADVANTDAQLDRPTNVDATAALANGTVTVGVTDNGDAYRGVNVSVEGETADDAHGAYENDTDDSAHENDTDNETDADEVVATTGENGTATVAVGNVSELEIELTAPGFAAELEYVVNNGSLVLVSEEYEYATAGNDTEDSRDRDSDDHAEAAADAPGHDGDLPDEASDEADENTAVGDDTDSENENRRGPPADVPADDAADDADDDEEDSEEEESEEDGEESEEDEEDSEEDEEAEDD